MDPLEHVHPRPTGHQTRPLFIKSCSRTAQIVLLCSGVLMVHFAVVILTPLKAFVFYYGFGKWIITRPDVKT
jgi:hypothetical protein